MSLPPGGGDVAAPAPSSGDGGGQPREGSRETHEGIIISEAWDWCKSSEAPVPYPITAKQIQAGNLANTVRQTDDKSHVRGSFVDRCEGDEGGTGGGVTSGTHNGACWPKTWSETVRFEGRNAVRHDDEWWMNNGNTWGKLQYVKNQQTYAPVQVASISPLMGLGSGGASESEASSGRGTNDLNSYSALAPSPRTDLDRKSLDPAHPRPIPNAGHEAHYGSLRVSATCDRLIGTYDEIKAACGGKSDEDESENDLSSNDHHMVPDFTMGGRRGCRESNNCRFDNMPNYGDMPAICLKGYTSDRGSEHQIVQSKVNSSIANLGPTPTLGQVLQWSKKDTVERLQHTSQLGDACAEDIRKEIDKAFEGKDLNQRVRGYTNFNQNTYDYLKKEGGQFGPAL